MQCAADERAHRRTRASQLLRDERRLAPAPVLVEARARAGEVRVAPFRLLGARAHVRVRVGPAVVQAPTADGRRAASAAKCRAAVEVHVGLPAAAARALEREYLVDDAPPDTHRP